MSNRNIAAPGDRLELLETFIRIADTGGIGSAARELGATQPTVTRRLQQLEATMGVKLIERGGHGISLTPSGAALLPEARELTRRWRRPSMSCSTRATLRSPGGSASSPRVKSVRRCCRLCWRALCGKTPTCGWRRASPTAQSIFWRTAPISGCAKARGTRTAPPRRRWEKCGGRSARRRVLAQELGDARGVAIQRCEPLALAGAPLIGRPGAYGAVVKFKGRERETLEVEFERVATVDSDDVIMDLALAERGVALLPTWRIAPMVRDGILTRIASDWAEEGHAGVVALAPGSVPQRRRIRAAGPHSRTSCQKRWKKAEAGFNGPSRSEAMGREGARSAPAFYPPPPGAFGNRHAFGRLDPIGELVGVYNVFLM